MLSSVAAFCAVPDKDTIDVSTANTLARDVVLTSWHTDQVVLDKGSLADLRPTQSMVLIAPTYPSKESLKITITNPKFALENTPLIFSIQRITDGVETEFLRAKVTCVPQSYNRPASFVIAIDTPVEAFYTYNPQEPAHTAGQTSVDVAEDTRPQGTPLQFATIMTPLPKDTPTHAFRLFVVVDLGKHVFPRFNFALQELHTDCRKLVNRYFIKSEKIEGFLKRHPRKTI